LDIAGVADFNVRIVSGSFAGKAVALTLFFAVDFLLLVAAPAGFERI